MGKIGGLAAAAIVALIACTASAAPAKVTESVAHVQALSVQSDMLIELRPILTTLKASDDELLREAYAACANLLFRDKDSYREAVLKDYPDVAIAVDHLTVAAAAKKYLCA